MKKLALAAALLSLAGAVHAHEVLYNVTQVYFEPMTQPKNTIFTGSFLYNEHTQTVSDLRGFLTESMTGTGTGSGPFYDMVQIELTHQLAAIVDPVLGGLLVTTFRNNSTNTFSMMDGGDGWSPGTGFGLHFGVPGGANPGNAYARIFVNTTDPTAALTQAQLDKLAYADCTPEGMMGATCMTGTTIAGYGAIGSMDGYPISQTIVAVPEPETYALFLAGLGLLGVVARKRAVH
jgi:hypothetical protein